MKNIEEFSGKSLEERTSRQKKIKTERVTGLGRYPLLIHTAPDHQHNNHHFFLFVEDGDGLITLITIISFLLYNSPLSTGDSIRTGC